MKNFFNKFFDKEKHNQVKIKRQEKKDVEIFSIKYEKYINDIQIILKNKKEINFLHSGHIGDIINVLPIIKEISLSKLTFLSLSNTNIIPAANFF